MPRGLPRLGCGRGSSSHESAFVVETHRAGEWPVPFSSETVGQVVVEQLRIVCALTGRTVRFPPCLSYQHRNHR